MYSETCSLLCVSCTETIGSVRNSHINIIMYTVMCTHTCSCDGARVYNTCGHHHAHVCKNMWSCTYWFAYIRADVMMLTCACKSGCNHAYVHIHTQVGMTALMRMRVHVWAWLRLCPHTLWRVAPLISAFKCESTLAAWYPFMSSWSSSCLPSCVAQARLSLHTRVWLRLCLYTRLGMIKLVYLQVWAW